MIIKLLKCIYWVVIIELRPAYITEYAEAMYGGDPSDIQTNFLFDDANLQYQLIRVGWMKDHYVYNIALHFGIRNDKVWVYRNNTEELVGDELMRKGVLQSDIVFGFHNPEYRQFTAFAVA